MISVLPRDPAATENHRLTMNQLSLCLPGLSPVQEKEIVARFDGGRLSSDGGVVLLREIEARLGLADRLSGCLLDGRDPELVWRDVKDGIVSTSSAFDVYGAVLCDDGVDLEETTRRRAVRLIAWPPRNGSTGDEGFQAPGK